MRKIYSLMLVAMMALSIMGCGNYDYDIVIDHAADLSGNYFVFSKSMWHTQDGDTKMSEDCFIEVKKNGMGVSVKLFENEDSNAVESVDFTYNELAGAVERYKVEGIPISRYTLNKGTFNVIFTIGNKNVYEAKPTIDYESEKASFHGMRDFHVSIEEIDYVEIGGVQWATMNLGATTVAGSPETCYGDYFAWGEVEPYYGSKLWDKTNSKWQFDSWIEGKTNGYSWLSYCANSEFQEWSILPYDDTNKNLKKEFDAATVAWGSQWRTPTKADFQALMKACTGISSNIEPKPLTSSSPKGGVYWLTSDQNYIEEYKGVAGILFVDMEDTSKRVFFPLAGYVHDNSFSGPYGRYWSSSLIPSTSTNASSLLFTLFTSASNNVIPTRTCFRNWGLPIRPVADIEAK